MTHRLFNRTDKRHQSDEHWIPLSDLMSGLMMVFLLIAILFMIQVESEAQKTEELRKIAEEQSVRMREIAVLYSDLREKLYADLYTEFQSDLETWSAELDRDLAIRFKEPEVLFASGKSELSSRFQEILSDFFPRYLRILSSPTYREAIQEVRIEGHTSSNWVVAISPEEAYMLNMALSQERTRAVLQYVLFMSRSAEIQNWLIGHLTANGLSSSKPRLNADGSENYDASRRVEFRIRTDADRRLADVLKAAKK